MADGRATSNRVLRPPFYMRPYLRSRRGWLLRWRIHRFTRHHKKMRQQGRPIPAPMQWRQRREW